ncbi:type II toxin-antitoxin system VapC family toxin [Sphingomonas sp.]|uniref:type II toxin-antitoxin system VapC family toxin n=1 Tax=Sphingomonas sp. TaxID=28214 RepID=UPI003B00F9C7
MIVLDASLVGPICIPDEAADLGPAAWDVMLANPLCVPGHWRLEVANMLRSAVRRERLTPAQRDLALRRLRQLPVRLDQNGWDTAWDRVIALSEAHDLTPYDASYLELAARLGTPLATRDRKLARAAEACAVVTLDFRT